jgi:hypothetical protein
MSRKFIPFKRRAKNEPVTIRAARIAGNYGIASAIVGAVVAAVLAFWLSNPSVPSTSRAPSATHTASVASTVHATHGVAAAATTPPPAAKTAPLRVLSENPIELAELGVWTFSGIFSLPGNGPDVNDGTAVANYMKAHGGYPVSSVIQLAVQNTRNYPIRILDIQVVKACHQPFTGTLFYNPPQGADPSIEIGLNLDSADPEAKVARGPNVTESDYFAQYTVSINPGSQQVFDIRTVTAKYACTFRYRMIVLDGQHEVSQLIGDGDQPFRIGALIGTGATRPFAKYALVYIGDDPSVPGSYGQYEKVDGKTFIY